MTLSLRLPFCSLAAKRRDIVWLANLLLGTGVGFQFEVRLMTTDSLALSIVRDQSGDYVINPSK